MELKILALPSGNGKVYSTTDKLADYIKLGYVDTGETIEVEVTDPSKEVIEMLLEDDIVTHLRYKGDNEWRAIAGGSGGTDTYKVKVDGTDTAEYLENKLVQGTNIVINKANGKMEVSCDIVDELPAGGATGQVLAKKTSADGDVEWVNQSGGSGAGVTAYADLAALKAVDTTAYKGGEIAYVTGVGSFEFLLDINITSDDTNILRPTNAIGKWRITSKVYKEEDWYTVGLKSGITNDPSSVITLDSFTGKSDVLSYKEPHSNILTRKSFEGRNKLMYIEIDVEAAYAGTSQNIFLRANKHAADGSDYSSLKITTNVGSGTGAYPLNVYACSGSTPTETLIASDITAITDNLIFNTTNYDLNDTIQISAKSYEKRVQVDIFSKRKKTRMRTLFVDNDAFNAMSSIFNGICMFAASSVNSFYGEIMSKTINIGTEYKNIVCLGDSLTWGGYVGGKLCWVNIMAYLKRKEPVSIYNAGAGGNTVIQAKARIETDVTPKFIEGADNICIIDIGVNDIYTGSTAEAIITSLEDLITTIKGLGWKVAVITLSNLFSPFVSNETTANAKVSTINAWILANSNIDVKIDLNARIKDPATGLTNRKYVKELDGVHFTSTVQPIIATTVLKSLGLD